jgi:hypothetical protein
MVATIIPAIAPNVSVNCTQGFEKGDGGSNEYGLKASMSSKVDFVLISNL